MPPLRLRRDDIPLLAQYFLKRYAQTFGKSVQAIAPHTMQLLCAHPWPGNVRELENVMERATNLANSNVILPQDLPLELVQARLREVGTPTPPLRAGLDLASQEANAIIAALRDNHGNVRMAARQLNISRGGLYVKMGRFGLSANGFRDLSL